MTSKAFENEFLKTLAQLSSEQQDKVLAYVKSIVTKTKNANPQDLLQFAGSIDGMSILEIRAAIETGCENIDENEW